MRFYSRTHHLCFRPVRYTHHTDTCQRLTTRYFLQAGVVHMDLRPANVLHRRTRDLDTGVGDFGVKIMRDRPPFSAI